MRTVAIGLMLALAAFAQTRRPASPRAQARLELQAVPPIHIIVRHGHLTLEGIVANRGERDIAGIQANRVPFVFSVRNNLLVEKKR